MLLFFFLIYIDQLIVQTNPKSIYYFKFYHNLILNFLIKYHNIEFYKLEEEIWQ